MMTDFIPFMREEWNCVSRWEKNKLKTGKVYDRKERKKNWRFWKASNERNKKGYP